MNEYPYQRIATYYRTMIRTGQLKAGAHLPTVRVLATDWAVNRATAQRAMAMLRTEGAIDTDGRRGTTVRPVHERVIVVPLPDTSTSTIILGTEVLTAVSEMARKLGVPEGSHVLVVRVAS